jgi:hypothetical protein
MIQIYIRCRADFTRKDILPQGCYVTIIPPPFFLMIGITDCIALMALEMASNVRLVEESVKYCICFMNFF